MTNGARIARLVLLVAPIVGGLGTQQALASTLTVATFADPSPDASMPLFQYDGNTQVLTGSWSGTGLTLETLVGDYADAKFTLSAAFDLINGGMGTLEFFDSASAPILTFEFGSSSLSTLGIGATEFMATDMVTMTGEVADNAFGPGLAVQESFAFAFANQVEADAQGSFTATASFTSSAIPEPASIAILAMGAALALRRRRRA